MYGSSFRMETRRPRALRIRPTLAAVMPLPREEVTPPVTKTYFAMGRVLRGFFECYRNGPPEASAVRTRGALVRASITVYQASRARDRRRCSWRCGMDVADVVMKR